MAEDEAATATAAAAAKEDEWKDDDFLSFGPQEEKKGDPETVCKPAPGASGDVAEAFLNQGRMANNSNNNRSTFGSNDLPPWMDQYTDFRRVSPLVALHNEIVGFCDLMSPMPEEMNERNELVQRFTTLAHKTFGGKEKCEVTVFGSQATGLCLPSSDIDIVIHLPDEEKKEAKQEEQTEGKDAEVDQEEDWDKMRDKSPLDRLADALREDWYDQLSYLEVIAKTKVPLVKFTHEPTNLNVDVSFRKETGPQAATLIKTFMEAMPPLRPLIFVLKYFLAARVLNEPYSGGVGSYMLQLMIVSFLQHRERDAVNFGKVGLYNLGCLLLEFFELYGTKFNSCTTVISVRHDGSYIRKAENKEAFFNPNRPFMMAIENPLDITADVGKASFRISMVQRAFAAAYKVLLAHVASPVEPCITVLGTIIPPTDEMVQRKLKKGSGIRAAQINSKLNGSLQSGRGSAPRRQQSGGDSPRKKRQRTR